MTAQGASILVVDDTEINQMLLKTLLEHEGFDVTVVSSGFAALEQVTESIPDLILLDVMMPKMNGFEACEKLQTLPQVRDVPIMFITALDDRKNKLQGLRSGAVDYITKPFARDEVLARINVHLNLRKARLQLLREDKMASLGQLVAGLAHEINNPISFIHGNLQYTERYIADLLKLVAAYGAAYPEPPETVQDCLEDVDFEFLRDDLPQMMKSMTDGTQRIADIVRSLRLFARLEEADCKAIDLPDSIESSLLFVQHRLQPSARYPAIDVIRQYAPDVPNVVCFAGAFNQAFMNIVVNAIDAIEEKFQALAGDSFQPHITISTQLYSPTHVQVTVADNGIGMSEAVQRRAFEQFYTTKIIGRGVGLGLSVAQQIIEQQHHGQLSLTSEVGQGSTLQMQFPITQPDCYEDGSD